MFGRIVLFLGVIVVVMVGVIGLGLLGGFFLLFFLFGIFVIVVVVLDLKSFVFLCVIEVLCFSYLVVRVRSVFDFVFN